MKTFLLLTLLVCAPLCPAQTARNHFGDDPRWADPNFDDSAWPVVQKAAFPSPPRQEDGLAWVGQRVTAPAGDAMLWLRLPLDNLIPNLPMELRVDGEVEAGLPLGIANGVQYPESVTRGERFTIVSDGVVEAPNANGELFGFEPAQEIAEAAKAWGQNDDITVVAVRRTM